MSIKALQDYTYYSKYARYKKDEKRRETWNEAVERVKNMHILKYQDRIEKFPEIADEIEWAFEQVRQKRVLGSQRALQFGGEPVLKKNARLYNCCVSFCDRIRFFQEAFWLLLCGCGAGFSVQKHHINKLPSFSNKLKKENNKVIWDKKVKYTVPDTIEGWADTLGILLASYFPHPDFYQYEGCFVEFDYSLIRPKGSYISSGSGKAPGPEPLRRSIEVIRELLNKCFLSDRNKFRSIDAYDIVMHASDAVLSGGVRRSATICIFSPDDELMTTAKTGNWLSENPQRARSNNSAILIRNETTKEQFEKLMESVKQFGEPGFVWSDSTELLVNPSLRKGTLVITEDGIVPIESLENKRFKVKNLNGEWSEAVCRLSGRGKKLIEITLENGKKYYATEEHKWPVYDKRKKCYFKKESMDLKKGDSLPFNRSNSLFESDFGTEEDGFLCGWNLTDGWKTIRSDNGKSQYGFIVSQEDAELGIKDKVYNILLEKVGASRRFSWSERASGCFEMNLQRASLKEYFDSFGLTSKDKGVPSKIWSSSESYRKGFIDAIFSADGHVIKKDGDLINIGFTTSKKQFAEDVHDLLGFYGIKSQIYKKTIDGSKRVFPNGKTYDKIYTVYTVSINNFDNVLHFANTFSLSSKKKDSILNELRGDKFHCDSKSKIKIKSVKETDIYEDVWDISVYDQTHCFQLSHCITGNCVEIGMWPVCEQTQESGWSFCNLSEQNGKKIKSEEDWKISARAASIIGTLQAGYTDFDYLGPATKRIVEREALLGVSITGMMDNPEVIFDAKLQRKMAKLVLDVNGELAPKLGINLAARATCVKPAGTSSCVLGTGSGIHPHHAKRYLRRVQGNELEAPLQWFKRYNSFAVEKSVWSANENDEVVTFCIEVPDGAKTKNDLSAVELLEYVKLTQQNWVLHGMRPELCTQPWLVHNVSNTINVRPDEWEGVAEFIYKNRRFFAGISLLPISGDKDYPQAPMCTIFTPREMLQEYGEGFPLASGLIVDGLHAFKDLWKACDAVLGMGEEITCPNPPETEDLDDYRKYYEVKQFYHSKKDWIRRAKQFAERYCDGNVKRMTYLLKDVNNWKVWLDLNREYQDVDYSEMIEEEDNTNFRETIACAGGKCDLV